MVGRCLWGFRASLICAAFHRNCKPSIRKFSDVVRDTIPQCEYVYTRGSSEAKDYPHTSGAPAALFLESS
jgi:hypothetical protein